MNTKVHTANTDRELEGSVATTHGIDLSPEVWDLEDGSVGYFYTLQQLEEIAWRRFMRQRLPDYKRRVKSLARD